MAEGSEEGVHGEERSRRRGGGGGGEEREKKERSRTRDGDYFLFLIRASLSYTADNPPSKTAQERLVPFPTKENGKTESPMTINLRRGCRVRGSARYRVAGMLKVRGVPSKCRPDCVASRLFAIVIYIYIYIYI